VDPTLAQEGALAVDFCGGEPLLHPNAAEILNATVEAGLRFGLVTNGTVLNQTLEDIILAHGTWIRFSVDTFDERLYAPTRRPVREACSLAALTGSMKSLLDRRRASGREDLRVGVNCVIDRRHTHGLCETVRQ